MKTVFKNKHNPGSKELRTIAKKRTKSSMCDFKNIKEKETVSIKTQKSIPRTSSSGRIKLTKRSNRTTSPLLHCKCFEDSDGLKAICECSSISSKYSFGSSQEVLSHSYNQINKEDRSSSNNHENSKTVCQCISSSSQNLDANDQEYSQRFSCNRTDSECADDSISRDIKVYDGGNSKTCICPSKYIKKSKHNDTAQNPPQLTSEETSYNQRKTNTANSTQETLRNSFRRAKKERFCYGDCTLKSKTSKYRSGGKSKTICKCHVFEDNSKAKYKCEYKDGNSQTFCECPTTEKEHLSTCKQRRKSDFFSLGDKSLSSSPHRKLIQTEEKSSVKQSKFSQTFGIKKIHYQKNRKSNDKRSSTFNQKVDSSSKSNSIIQTEATKSYEMLPEKEGSAQLPSVGLGRGTTKSYEMLPEKEGSAQLPSVGLGGGSTVSPDKYLPYHKTIKSLTKDRGKTSYSSQSGQVAGYDPYKHRIVEKPINNMDTLTHLIKAMIGTGVLAMPQAFVNSGLFFGIVMTIVCGAVFTHCLNTLFRVQYILCKRRQVPFLTYSQAIVAAVEDGPIVLMPIAKCIGAMATTFTILLQLGICSCYIVFLGGTLKRIVDPYFVISIGHHMSIVTGPLIFLNFIKSLKTLAPFSLAANVLGLASLIGIAVFLLKEPKLCDEPIDIFGSILSYPLFFGTALFALTATGAVISIEKDMKTPESFVHGWFGLLNIGMAIVVSIYVVVGVIGYYHCKSQCLSNITLNLPMTLFVKILWVLYALSISVSYVLHCIYPVDTIWKLFFEEPLKCSSKGKIRFWKYFLRFIVTVSTLLCVALVRRLGVIVSFLSVAVVTIILPAFMELSVALSYKFSMTKYIIVFKDVLLIFIGFVILLVFILISFN